MLTTTKALARLPCLYLLALIVRLGAVMELRSCCGMSVGQSMLYLLVHIQSSFRVPLPTSLSERKT